MFGLNRFFSGGSVTHRQETGGTRGGYQSDKASGLSTGLVAGTWVATAIGWRPVEAIAKGDMVLTFDRGMLPVREVTRSRHWQGDTVCPPSLWPLMVPAGALGNQEPMALLPEQYVMVESDTADMLFGDPFSLLEAAGLDGFRGIERALPADGLEVVQLHFDEDEVVFANAGALVFCPGVRALDIAAMLDARDTGTYHVLPGDEATMLVDCLRDEDAVAGGWTPGPCGGAGYAACA